MSKTKEETTLALEAIKKHLEEIEFQQKVLLEQVKLARGTKHPGDVAFSTVQSRVLEDIRLHPGTARKEIAERTSIEPREITKIVTDLQNDHRLIQVGRRKATRWFSPEYMAEFAKDPKHR